MQSPYIHQSIDSVAAESSQAVKFQTRFAGYMEMYSDAQQVAAYLSAHEGWFCRCAEPMKTSPLGKNGYILTVGQYGAFGYEVEPKMAVVLEPPANTGVYYMHSIPIPNEPSLGYEVDYQATMQLEEVPRDLAAEGLEKSFAKLGKKDLPNLITKVTWQLHLNIWVNFPKFIQKLPNSLIQQTGDRLLNQIVKQISPRLTYKVQQDFHSRFSLPIPAKASRQLLPLQTGI
jgi:hypothetical protein